MGFTPAFNNKRNLPDDLKSESPGPPAQSPALSPSVEQIPNAPSPPAPASPAPPIATGPSTSAAARPESPSSGRIEHDVDSLNDPFDDLPRMPDTSSEEENEDNNAENVDNDPETEEIPNEPLNLHLQFPIEANRRPHRGLGRAVKGNSYFMQGKYLILQINDGETNICALCNMYAPLDEGKSEQLSFELQKKLFRNGMLEQRGDGFGICYNRQGGLNQWQIICKSCLSYDGQEQDVIDSCYRVNFHIENGNIKSDSDARDIFQNAPELANEVMRDIRDDFIKLNRAYSLDMRYFNLKLTRKFYFTPDESRVLLGLDGDEIDYIYVNYLRPFASRYEVFDVKEIFATLMLMLRSGQPLSWVHRMLVKYTDHPININSLSKALRKTLYFLGKNLY